MTTQPDPDLRATLHRLAESTTPLPVDDGLWQRGQAARRRGQAFAVAAVLALVVSVGGIATLVTTTDREARMASGEEVEGGAIPSRIVDPGELATETALDIGTASVAFVSSAGEPVVIGADDGRYHALRLEHWENQVLSLSPSGRTLVWSFLDETDPRGAMGGIGILDLVTGEHQLRLISDLSGSIVLPQAVSWSPSGQWLTWFDGDLVGRMPVGPGASETSATGKQVEWSAVDDDGVVTLFAQGPRQWSREGSVGRMKTAEDTVFDASRSGRNRAAVAAPGGSTFALTSDADPAAVDFLASGRFVERPLPTELYPANAAVHPLGWSADTLVLARVEAPAGSYVEGPHLALFTAPNAPEDTWTYRVVLRDIPATDTLTVATDLIPDLDGTSSQQLTHDFGDVLAEDERDISWIIGLGVAAAIAVLMGLRWLWRRFF